EEERELVLHGHHESLRDEVCAELELPRVFDRPVGEPRDPQVEVGTRLPDVPVGSVAPALREDEVVLREELFERAHASSILIRSKVSPYAPPLLFGVGGRDTRGRRSRRVPPRSTGR